MCEMRKILLIIPLLALFACNDDLFNESIVINNAEWEADNMPFFDIDVEDTVAVYSFSLNVRHLENYKYSNLFVFLHTSFPNGNITHDTIECVLAFPDGRWAGRGSGSMRSAEIRLNDHLRFPLKGIYRFEIEQAMREPVLKGITDVGISVSKVQ